MLNVSFPISLGLLPVTLQLETTGCGIKNSGLPDDEAGDIENNSKFNAFLHIFCNIFMYLCYLYCSLQHINLYSQRGLLLFLHFLIPLNYIAQFLILPLPCGCLKWGKDKMKLSLM